MKKGGEAVLSARNLLAAVRLSKNEEGLYYNDALLLDFGQGQVLVALSGKEGLAVDAYGRPQPS